MVEAPPKTATNETMHLGVEKKSRVAKTARKKKKPVSPMKSKRQSMAIPLPLKEQMKLDDEKDEEDQTSAFKKKSFSVAPNKSPLKTSRNADLKKLETEELKKPITKKKAAVPLKKRSATAKRVKQTNKDLMDEDINLTQNTETP